MKTMLNRKLVKTGLFTIALVFLVIVSRAAGTQPPTDSTKTTNDSLKYAGAKPVITVRPELITPPAIRLNKQASKFVSDYIAQNEETLEKIKAKSNHAFTVIDEVFCKYELPVELKYLAVVESELNTKARSRVGAVGTWQFMPQTARILSLKVTSKYDERKHLYKSTVAAARYLNDLHDQFGDWLLVIAAYNAGPGNVLKAIKRSGSRDFWKLQYFLPAETRGHVKKFIGTHYYFEGKGSMTVLTKAETAAYARAMDEFAKKQAALENQANNEEDPAEENNAIKVNTTAGILNDEEK
jgi:membrane-bound lytic murein transglycosylase D